MRNTLKYEIEYFIKGKDLVKEVSIKRLSNRAIDSYRGLAEEIGNYTLKAQEIAKLQKEIGWIISEPAKGSLKDKYNILKKKREATKPLIEKAKELQASVKDVSNKAMLKKRIDLMTIIFNDNGIDDEDLLSFDWWNDNTEPATAWDFIKACMLKDVDSEETKKKE